MDLNNNPIWNDCQKILDQIEATTLVGKHLKKCHYQVRGYSDGTHLYKEINFTTNLAPELISSTLGYTWEDRQSNKWIKLTFSLQAESRESLKESVIDDREIAELTLILDENLELIDENWFIDVDSNFVVAKREEDVERSLSLA